MRFGPVTRLHGHLPVKIAAPAVLQVSAAEARAESSLTQGRDISLVEDCREHWVWLWDTVYLIRLRIYLGSFALTAILGLPRLRVRASNFIGEDVRNQAGFAPADYFLGNFTNQAAYGWAGSFLGYCQPRRG